MSAAEKEVRDQTSLIPVENINAIEVFTGDGLSKLLKKIEKSARSIVPDADTPKGRQEIKSTAFAVTKSKTTIDAAGKSLVADWKRQAAEVDAGRRTAREFLTDLAKDIRQPLTDWEEDQERIEAEKKLQAEIEAAHDDALEMNRLWDREQELMRREAEIARQEEERIERERQEKLDAERKAHEDRIAREAEEKAQREAEEKARLEREEAAEKLRLEREAKERAEQEAKAAEARSKQQAEEAAEQARKKAEREAEEREQRRQAEEAWRREEDRVRAENKANRKRVDASIVAALVEAKFTEKKARELIQLVASGSIPRMSIRY